MWLRFCVLLLFTAAPGVLLGGCAEKAAESPPAPVAEIPETEPAQDIEPIPEDARLPAFGAKKLDNGEVGINGFRVRVTPVASHEMGQPRRVSVTRAGRKLYEATFKPDAQVYFADMNGDSDRECIVARYSMGAHCCFDYTGLWFDGRSGRVRQILRYDGGGDNMIYQARLLPARAGQFRSIVTADDRFTYFGDLPHAYSPYPAKVLKFTRGLYSPATSTEPGLLRAERRRAYAELANALKGEGMYDEDERVCRSKAAALEAWVYGFLLADERETLRRLNQIAPQEVTSWLSDHRDEAVAQMRARPF